MAQMRPTQPRLLIMIPQFPHDPANGAARDMTSAGELLARRGFEVLFVGTTASEQYAGASAAGTLDELGVRPRANSNVWRFKRRGVSFAILNVGDVTVKRATEIANSVFDALLARELRRFRPHHALVYGQSAPDRARMRMLLDHNVAVTFGLFSIHYHDRTVFDPVRATYVPSRYLRDLYAERFGLRTTVIRNPLITQDVLAPPGPRPYLTMVNPSYAKGAAVVARIAAILGHERPDIPLLLVEGRATAGTVVLCGHLGKLDLHRNSNLHVLNCVPLPRDIFAQTRILLVPSLEEAAGRVAAEAMINGIPPLVSDRGGLPETVGRGGIVVPLPPDLTLEQDKPVDEAAARPWVDQILRLWDSDSAYREASRKARAAARRFNEDRVADRLVRLFTPS